MQRAHAPRHPLLAASEEVAADRTRDGPRGQRPRLPEGRVDGPVMVGCMAGRMAERTDEVIGGKGWVGCAIADGLRGSRAAAA